MADVLGYGLTLMDPPWWTPGGQSPTYGMVRDRDMAECIASQPNFLPAEGSAVFMWVVNLKIPLAVDLFRGFGLEWLTMVTWDKGQGGHGRYFRSQTEHLVFGRRGKLTMPRAPWATTLHRELRSRVHSRKPEGVYQLLERLPFERRAELFARQHRDGWTCSGNEL